MGERKRSIPWVFAVTCGGFTERQAELLPSPSGYYQYISYIQYIMHSVHRFAYVIYISVYLCQHLMRLALYFSDQCVVHSKMFFCLVVMGDCLSYCCLPVSSKQFGYQEDSVSYRVMNASINDNIYVSCEKQIFFQSSNRITNV